MSFHTCPDCGETFDDKGTPHEEFCEGSREDLIARVTALRAALDTIATYEAAQLAKENGAGSVYVLAVARAALRGETVR